MAQAVAPTTPVVKPVVVSPAQAMKAYVVQGRQHASFHRVNTVHQRLSGRQFRW